MNNLILSTEDIYRAFLFGIRKESTTVVKPVVFNTFINRVILEVVKSKLPLVEFSQKRIDDLEWLRVVTDGEGLTASYEPIDSTIPAGTIYNMPVELSSITGGIMYSNLNDINYPLYLHGLNVMFRFPVNNNDWVPATLRKSDKTVMMTGDPYSQPTATRIYYEHIGTQIRKIGGNGETEMRLEYIRYPKIINYSTTPGEMVDPESPPSFNQEITETAIRIYLERIVDPRYKSFLQEEMIRSQTK